MSLLPQCAVLLSSEPMHINGLCLLGFLYKGLPSLLSLLTCHSTTANQGYALLCRAQAPDEVVCSEVVTVKLTQCNHTIGVKCGEVEAVKVSQQTNTGLH